MFLRTIFALVKFNKDIVKINGIFGLIFFLSYLERLYYSTKKLRRT